MANIRMNGINVNVYSFNTVVVGSGAAGLNALDRLFTYGQRDIALVTEGLNKGTSRNTGSDKQTYYKLTLAGKEQDSIHEMAQTLFDGGAMDGDIALVEAALSAQCFYNLVSIGVPFPHNIYGEYVGYKTDHDPRQRATSIGPLTSRVMVEKLQEQVMAKNIPIFDGYQVVRILVDEATKSAIGLLTLNLNKLEDPSERWVVFACANTVYATGGPAGIYQRSVYPASQTGSTGIALEAGVMGRNVTESQYGLASLSFRWNLSGTYQQVLPRYVSTAQDGGDQKEFLQEYFPNPTLMLKAIFLKGYQWPFDARKIANYGSSLIDVLVYHETLLKGRRVFLDFTTNPSWQGQPLDFAWLDSESRNYLERSGALFGDPIERLERMNRPAIQLYLDNGIDLYSELLEIAVCAQHNNGGLLCNIWWESNLRHFFPVGEVSGTHGVYRPGGSALNSGQVGSARAAEYIANRYTEEPPKAEEIFRLAGEQITEKLNCAEQLLINQAEESNLRKIRRQIGLIMDEVGACIRSRERLNEKIVVIRGLLDKIWTLSRLKSSQELGYAFQNYDLLVTAYAYLSSIKDCIEKGVRSRGSYLIHDFGGDIPHPRLPDLFRYTLDDGTLGRMTQLVTYSKEGCTHRWVPVKPIPNVESWFETVWHQFRTGRLFSSED